MYLEWIEVGDKKKFAKKGRNVKSSYLVVYIGMGKHWRPFIFISVWLLAGISVKGQVTNVSYEQYSQYYLQRDSFQNQIGYLRQEFATNKVIPKEVETEVLAALSFYPELRNTFIEFKFTHIHTTMACRPKTCCLFESRSTRKYIILINKPGKDNGTLSWDEMSFNALVGWVGHELGHIAYYRQKSVPGIIAAGIRYLHPKYKRDMERQTDMTAIQHDMGFALYEGVRYTFCCSRANPDYKASLKKYYLSLDEILQHSSVRLHKVLRKKKKAEASLTPDY